MKASMPTTRIATVTTPLLAATPVLTTIQENLIANESTVQETKIDREMMAMLQREIDITKESGETTIAETVIGMLHREVVVIVSQTLYCPLPLLLLLVVLVLWLLLLTGQIPLPKVETANTKKETEIEKEIGREIENASSANAINSTSESSANARENCETESTTDANMRGNVTGTWTETARKNERGLTIARHELVKGPGTGTGIGINPGILRRLKAVKTGTEAQDDTVRLELMDLLRKRKMLDMELMTVNALPSLIACTPPTTFSVFLNANALPLPIQQRLTLTKIIVAVLSKHRETCRGRMITQTQKEKDA